jgi:hypothetical protein
MNGHISSAGDFLTKEQEKRSHVKKVNSLIKVAVAAAEFLRRKDMSIHC